MPRRIKNVRRADMDAIAERLGFKVHRECGGYRIIGFSFPDGSQEAQRYDVWPVDGICPVATRHECYLWLIGFETGRQFAIQDIKKHLEWYENLDLTY